MSETLSVRPSVATDLADIDALLSLSYPALLKSDYPPSVLVTAVPLISKANPQLVTSGTYFVLVDRNDAIVGAGGWTKSAPPGFGASAGLGHIRHIVTDHRRVRQGIGRRLMQHIVSDAATAGVTQLDCFSTLMAVPFYVAFGFRVLGPITVPLRPGIDFPAIHMRRLVSKPD
jgi:GNAT superfamily N-acetyltransferase